MLPKHWLIAAYIVSILAAVTVTALFDSALTYVLALAFILILILPYYPLIRIHSKKAAWIFLSIVTILILISLI